MSNKNYNDTIKKNHSNENYNGDYEKGIDNTNNKFNQDSIKEKYSSYLENQENKYFPKREQNNLNLINNHKNNLSDNMLEYAKSITNQNLNNKNNNCDLDYENRNYSELNNANNINNYTNINNNSNKYDDNKSEIFQDNNFRNKYKSFNNNDNLNIERKFNFDKLDLIKNDWKDKELKNTNSFKGSKIDFIGNVSGIDDTSMLNHGTNNVLDPKQEFDRKKEENNLNSKKFSSEKRTFRYEHKGNLSIFKNNLI